MTPAPPTHVIPHLAEVSYAPPWRVFHLIASDIVLALESIARLADRNCLKLNYIASKGGEAEKVFLKILGESIAE
ncbi:MAG: hypothetical protein DRK00_06345 [Thermoprotei archaeon]|nr:MAG: hypothetical protein DRK00_06345 [Thermoprotei archaeon]